MLNTVILILTVLVFLVSLKRLFTILKSGSPEVMVKRKEDALSKFKDDLTKPESKQYFVIAWSIGVAVTLTTLSLSTYVLTQILKFA